MSNLPSSESSRSVRVELSTAPYEGVDARELSLKGLDLYITMTCDRRCLHCFLTDEQLDSRATMGTDMIAEIINWATAPGSNVKELTLLGGEPSRHPDFPNVVQLIHEAGLGVRVVTNGSPAFRKAFETFPNLANQVDSVSLSIDAPESEANDKVRGNGAFEWTEKTANMLKELQVPFDVNTTVLKDTIESLAQMIEYAQQLEAKRLNIHWFSLAGRGKVHSANQQPSPTEWRRVLNVVAEYRRLFPSMIIDCELSYAYGLPGEDKAMCKVQTGSNLQISPDRTATICGMLAESPEKSGYIWQRGNLVRRQSNADEIALVGKAACSGCPLREPQDNLQPLCIYNRLAHKL